MKPIKIAKHVWDHAKEVADATGCMRHYFGILTRYAAAQAAYYSQDEAWMQEILTEEEKYPFAFEEPSVFFKYNFDNYRVGGLTKAWLCMKGYFGEEHRELVREYAEKTLVAPRSRDGILCLPSCPQDEKIWIDVVYAVVPYMLYASLMFDEKRYLAFAVDQCFKMYDVFLDESNGLLHQSRGFMGDRTAISHDHWSRGNAWGYIGLTELVRYLPEDSEYRVEAVRRFREHSEAILRYQDLRGLWRQSMAEPLAWEESSGTGIFLYGFGVGLRLGLLEKELYQPALEKGLKGIMTYCIGKDYSVERCCQGCLCPGDTSDRKGTIEAYLVDVAPVRDDGHAFGPVILAMEEAHRNGIRDLFWR